MSLAGLTCETCKYRKDEKPAIHWCSECEEGLCADCFTHHTHSKALKKHSILPIANYDQLPDFIKTIKQYCKLHDEKYEFYCQVHLEPCCKYSKDTDHKNCKDVVLLQNAIDGSKSEIQEMKEEVETFKQKVDHVWKAKETNLKLIKEQKQLIQKLISETKKQLMTKFEMLEKDLMDEMRSKETEITDKTEAFIINLKKEKDKVEDLEKKITAINDYATNFQSFLGMKELRKEIVEHEKIMKTIFESTQCYSFEINCEIDERIKTFSTEVKQFGSIQTKSSPIEVVLTPRDIGSATKSVSVPATTVDTAKAPLVNPPAKTLKAPVPALMSAKATPKRTIIIPEGNNKNAITSCLILPNGKFVFVDGTYNQRVLVLNSNGTTSAEISLAPSFAFDVTCIDNKTIAVSSGSSSQIAIINIASKKTRKTIATAGECDGISHENGKLVCAVYQRGIYAIDLLSRDQRNTLIRKDNVTVDTYLTAFEDRVYHTNWKSDTVTCYDMKGEIIWVYSDEKLLQKPRGVAVDKKHNLFIVSLGTESILMVSADGKQGKTILTKNDGIENIRAIFYDRDNELLLVSSMSGTAYLFEISN